MPDNTLTRIAAELGGHGKPVQWQDGNTLISRAPFGALQVHVEAEGLTMRLEAGTEAQLQMLRESFLHFLDHAVDGVSGQVVWSGHRFRLTTPPNFRLVTVRGVDRSFPSWYRVHMHGEDMAPYGRDGMHFRLLLPPEGRVPDWPIGADVRQSVGAGSISRRSSTTTAATSLHGSSARR
ncbi:MULTISPECIES: SIP domain-containing protein [Actibacterium]|uniref:Uncharacterized protein n=1 Tax=Actibacterium naphthalenivorans TaxID=1614693 RepID=A0A840CKD5_9RHOB|nr:MULTISPECIES: hypothetical protein [Actibacterium]MBB4023968.1 hypothetical protein [Actibacterium naphthalenivorans]